MTGAQLLYSYIKRHRKLLVLLLLMCAILATVLLLYNIPPAPLAYALLLCAVVGLAMFLYAFLRYRQRYLQLQELEKRIAWEMDGLPEPKDAIEQEYQQLIQTVYADRQQVVSRTDQAQSEATQYYTLWAHQIKTPIAAQRLLLQSEQTPQNRELLLELFKVEQYVEMVLQYQRLGSMSSDLVLEWYDLDTIVRQAVRKFRQQFIHQKIKLDFAPTQVRVLTDEKWLLFVIEQLLSNALKYTPAGTIAIHMHPDAKKTLVIQDSGIGIRAEDLPRIFEKGFTGYNGRGDKRATGIGLHLSKQILDKLGHGVCIFSEPGEGTRVYLDLQEAALQVE